MVDIDFQNSLLVISLHYIGDIISFGGKITHFILYMQIFRLTISIHLLMLYVGIARDFILIAGNHYQFTYLDV